MQSCYTQLQEILDMTEATEGDAQLPPQQAAPPPPPPAPEAPPPEAPAPAPVSAQPGTDQTLSTETLQDINSLNT
ncbi:MAG: hypothetical protein HOC60_03845 [Rhodospirillaceae bacterium]|nr:hypothetical protein [Rhodospirillaceae bacterium]